MDLEPEGKVYICISLTGTFVDGKATIKNVYVRVCVCVVGHKLFVALVM